MNIAEIDRSVIEAELANSMRDGSGQSPEMGGAKTEQPICSENGGAKTQPHICPESGAADLTPSCSPMPPPRARAGDSTARQFVCGLNIAFFDRSLDNDRVPYREKSAADIFADADAHHLVYIIDGSVVGGLSYKVHFEASPVSARISDVYVLPEHRGKGIAASLMKEAERRAAKDGARTVSLDVGNIITPARALYKSMGYVPLSVYANEAHTYYFMRYIKALPPHKIPRTARICSLISSWLRFILLFRRDSTPRPLHRLIYGKKK